MIKIAIVEDETEHAYTLKSHLLKYATDYKETFSIEIFQNAIVCLEPYRDDYDIVFMDIRMPYMDGISAAHKLRELDKNVLLFFTSSLQQYATQGYDVDAIHYMVKPIGYYEFALKFSKAMDKLEKSNKSKYILVSTDLGYKKLAVNDIKYVSVRNHHCIYYTTEGEYKQYQPLKQAEELLAGSDFIKCNNYTLVNLQYVTSLNGMSLQLDDVTLDISRPRKKEVVKAFTEFYATRR